MRPLLADDRFVAGSMFWVRLEALRTLLDAPLQPRDFEPESGQIDGTLAHAIERIVAASVAQAGWRVAGTADVCGETVADAAASGYRFAKQG